MQLAALAEVAGVAVAHDDLDKRLAAQPPGQTPGLGLGEPHKRGLDDEVLGHAEIERQLHGVERVAPAVRIAGEVGLAHAAHQPRQPAPVGQRRGVDEEGQVAAGHEGRGQALLGQLDRPVGGERALGHRAEALHLEHVVGAQPLAPGGEGLGHAGAHRLAGGQLHRVPLAVVEAHGLDPPVALQRPGQADGGILSAGEQHEGARGLVHRPHMRAAAARGKAPAAARRRKRGNGPPAQRFGVQ
jgi:hypothetical protein